MCSAPCLIHPAVSVEHLLCARRHSENTEVSRKNTALALVGLRDQRGHGKQERTKPIMEGRCTGCSSLWASPDSGPGVGAGWASPSGRRAFLTEENRSKGLESEEFCAFRLGRKAEGVAGACMPARGRPGPCRRGQGTGPPGGGTQAGSFVCFLLESKSMLLSLYFCLLSTVSEQTEG